MVYVQSIFNIILGPITLESRHIKPVNARDNGGQPCEVAAMQHYLKFVLHNADDLHGNPEE